MMVDDVNNGRERREVDVGQRKIDRAQPTLIARQASQSVPLISTVLSTPKAWRLVKDFVVFGVALRGIVERIGE